MKPTCKHTYTDKHGYCLKCKMMTRMSISDIETMRKHHLVTIEQQKRLDFFYYGIV